MRPSATGILLFVPFAKSGSKVAQADVTVAGSTSRAIEVGRRSAEGVSHSVIILGASPRASVPKRTVSIPRNQSSRGFADWQSRALDANSHWRAAPPGLRGRGGLTGKDAVLEKD